MSDNAAERELGLTVARALNERRSCRAFQPSRPVSDALLNELLTLAARAPSGGNTQPWRVYALRGTALEQLTTATSAAVRSGQLSEDEVPFQMYPPRDASAAFMSRRRAVARDLYQTMGIRSDDKVARANASLRNFVCFDAPCLLIITVSRLVDRNGWAHVGCFLMSILLAAQALGLATCPQECWSSFPELVRKHAKYSNDEVLWCGIALGYADENNPVNRMKTERESVEVFARL